MAEEVSVPPGGGPPPHIHHREDESFDLQQGTLTLQVGGQTLHASLGDFVYLPRGIVHSFQNIGNGDAKMLVTVTRAGLEKFFEEPFYPAVDGSAAPLPVISGEAAIRAFDRAGWTRARQKGIHVSL